MLVAVLRSVQEEFSYVVEVEPPCKPSVCFPLQRDPGIPCAQPANCICSHQLMLVGYSFN